MEFATEAARRGFGLFGIAPATEADTFPAFERWLDAGMAGEMGYLHKHRDARRHPKSVVPGVRSVVMLGLEYAGESRHGVAKYAQGPDYHDVIWKLLGQLGEWLTDRVPEAVSRGVVDTAPLLERDFARRAGLGWFGKNTMLINKRRGSYFFLAALLTSLDFPSDPPHETAHCGTCTRCLEACPTQAFSEPGVLDARKCISYLTIELRGPIPEPQRPDVGGWLFGCDICQDVCPWNRRGGVDSLARSTNPDLAKLDLVEILELDEVAFRQRFRGTAFLRAKRSGLLRNAAIVLGNTAGPEVLPILQKASKDADPVVRDAAEWAIRQIKARG